MANERYTEKAVRSLLAYIESQLGTELDAIETEQSLTSGALGDPSDFVPAMVADDNRSPLVEIYDAGFRFEDQLNSIAVVDCVVAISFASDCDVEAGKRMMQRYHTALLNTLRDNPTLSGSVIQSIIGGADTEATRGDDSTTRFSLEQPVEVWLQDA